MGKAVLPRPPLASGVMGILIPRPKKKAKTATAPTSRAPPSVETSFIVAHSEEAEVLLSSPTPIFTTAVLPELFRSSGNLRQS